MDRNEILIRLTDVFQDIFGRDDLEITEDVEVQDIEGWDSLRHVRLLSAIESEFNMEFSLEDLQKTKSVRSIMEYIEKACR